MSAKKSFPKNAADFWLNLLICALLGALLAQCAVFLAHFVKSGKSDGEIPFEMQMLSTSTRDSRLNIDAGLFQPSLIAVSSEGKSSAVLNSAEVVREVYADISPCLFDALQNEPVAVSDARWNEAAVGENYVYVQYPAEFPYQVVFAYAAAAAESDAQIRRAGTYIGVREALLLPDESGKISLVFVRGNDGSYVFAYQADTSMDVFSVYPEAYPDVFYPGVVNLVDGRAEFSVTEKIAARDIYVSEIGVSALLSNRSHLEALFRLLNYNPDKLRYHTETDGTFVYVESHGVLRMDARSIQYSATEQGGIPLSRIVGRGATGDIYSYLRAASHIVWRLSDMDPLYTGGDAGLLLRSVTTSEGAVSLHFGFCSDNVEIYRSDRNTGLTVTFKNDKIVDVSLHMTIVRRSANFHRLMLQSWCREYLAPGVPAALRPVYRMEESAISMSAEWLVEVLHGEEEDGQ